MRSAFRGGNMGFRSVVASPKGSTNGIDYGNLLIAQIGVANKFEPTISAEKLLAIRPIAGNKKIFEDSFLTSKLRFV